MFANLDIYLKNLSKKMDLEISRFVVLFKNKLNQYIAVVYFFLRYYTLFLEDKKLKRGLYR